MKDETPTRNVRVSRLRELAGRLEFIIQETEDGFTLTRSVDVSRPVREERLTLREAEELLETWKLRGAHGG